MHLRTKLLEKKNLAKKHENVGKNHRWLLQKQPEHITVESTVIHTDYLTATPD